MTGPLATERPEVPVTYATGGTLPPGSTITVGEAGCTLVVPPRCRFVGEQGPEPVTVTVTSAVRPAWAAVLVDALRRTERPPDPDGVLARVS